MVSSILTIKKKRWLGYGRVAFSLKCTESNGPYSYIETNIQEAYVWIIIHNIQTFVSKSMPEALNTDRSEFAHEKFSFRKTA
jgi:hypothetical protein